jgi:outer membrane protein TolC
MKYLCILIPLFLTFSAIKAQENETAKLTPDEYSRLQLPPLSVLFENARKSPIVEYYNIRREEQERILKTEKRRWLEFFKGSAGYQYGKNGVIAYSGDNVNVYSDTKQSFYNVGASLSIPLVDIFDRANRIKRQELAMKSTGMEMERWYDEQKLRIIEAYTSAEQFLALLKIKIEGLAFANAQYKAAESDFINGKINTQELNTQKGYQVTAYTEYEQNRVFLNKALYELEVLSRTKIVNK